MIFSKLNSIFGINLNTLKNLSRKVGINPRKHSIVFLNKKKTFQVKKITKLKLIDKNLRIKLKKVISFKQNLKIFGNRKR